VAVTGFIVTIGSESPERLRKFYADVVALTPLFDFTPGAFSVANSSVPVLIIEEHDEVKGTAREPERMLLNFLVDDMAAEEARLAGQGVEFVRAPYEEPGVGLFATFADLDGNLCQLIQLYS
jgi:predicted enzyme related to lactoylglutathione lyase